MKTSKQPVNAPGKKGPAEDRKKESGGARHNSKTGNETSPPKQKSSENKRPDKPVTNKDKKVTNKDAEERITNEEEENKGYKLNKQRKALGSDIRNTSGRNEDEAIHKKIHTSPGNDVKPMK